MKKGISAKQNIALLRYARALNIQVFWNLLYGFPGEQETWFAEVLGCMPVLEHLQAPEGLHQITLTRFSPFFMMPGELGFSNFRPAPGYAEIFPGHPNLNQIAYHFCADAHTPTFADSALLPQFEAAFQHWKQRWKLSADKPNLLILEIKPDQYLLIDSRSWRAQALTQTITYAQAAACLVEHKVATLETAWALEMRTVIEYDGAFLPLAIADPQVMLRFERAHANTSAQAGAARAVVPIKVSTTTSIQGAAGCGPQ